MSKYKSTLLLIAVFILAAILALYYEYSYRVFIRKLFIFYQGERIQFIGKGFYLFGSPYFGIAFGIFAVLFSLLLYKQKATARFMYAGLTVFLIFISTVLATYLDSSLRVAKCTACPGGVVRLHYNEISYNFHFIASLIVALLPLGISSIGKMKRRL